MSLSVEISVGDRIFAVENGQVCVVEPGVPHLILTPISEEHRVAIILMSEFHLMGLDANRLLFPGDAAAVDLQRDSVVVNMLVRQLLAEFKEKAGQDGDELCNILLSAVIVLICRNLTEQNNIQLSDITEKTKKYIEEHLHEDITLTGLSEKAYVSLFHLARKFKEEVGISPIQYLINCRIDKAKELLRTTGHSVSAISHMVGYSNTNYFSLLFKRVEGLSPGRYRGKHKGKGRG